MRNTKGFAALSAVLLISAVVMAVVTTVTMQAIGEGQTALAVDLGNTDQYLVDGCAEDVMQKIHDLATYSTASITRPEGTCTITYTLGGPVNWDLTIKESGTTFGKIVRVVFTRGMTNVITSWTEI
jgi:hypothetical protein